jgi:hypothetical protein
MVTDVEGRQADVGCVCERELRDGTRGRRAHLPDGVVETDRGRIAIEVELTPKTKERVRDIFRVLLYEYDRVVYYAARRTARVVRAAAGARLDKEVLVRPYPPPRPVCCSAHGPDMVPPDTAESGMAAVEG